MDIQAFQFETPLPAWFELQKSQYCIDFAVKDTGSIISGVRIHYDPLIPSPCFATICPAVPKFGGYLGQIIVNPPVLRPSDNRGVNDCEIP